MRGTVPLLGLIPWFPACSSAARDVAGAGVGISGMSSRSHLGSTSLGHAFELLKPLSHGYSGVRGIFSSGFPLLSLSVELHTIGALELNEPSDCPNRFFLGLQGRLPCLQCLLPSSPIAAPPWPSLTGRKWHTWSLSSSYRSPGLGLDLKKGESVRSEAEYPKLDGVTDGSEENHRNFWS